MFVWILSKCVVGITITLDHQLIFILDFDVLLLFCSLLSSMLPQVSKGCTHTPVPCVRTFHAPSLTCCKCHTLDTNKDISLISTHNHGQGDTVLPTARTPPPNSLRSSSDFLPGRSPNMLASPALSTFLALEGGLDDKLSPHILFWIFTHLSWILLDSSLCDICLTLNLSASWGIFMISCWNLCTMVKAKWPGLSTYMTFLHSSRMQMSSMKSRSTYCFHTHTSWIPTTMVPQPASRLRALTYVVLWSNWIYFSSFWSWTSWQKTIKKWKTLQESPMDFCSASVYFNLKLPKTKLNSNIFGIDLKIAFTNHSIPRWS